MSYIDGQGHRSQLKVTENTSFGTDAVDYLKSESEVGKISYGLYVTVTQKHTSEVETVNKSPSIRKFTTAKKVSATSSEGFVVHAKYYDHHVRMFVLPVL